VSADIVKSAEQLIFAKDQEEREACNMKGYVVAWLGKTTTMGGINPALRLC
jgi:hypothetical protein